jgi:hypothetical protein
MDKMILMFLWKGIIFKTIKLRSVKGNISYEFPQDKKKTIVIKLIWDWYSES